MSTDTLDPQRITWGLPTRFVGQNVVYFESIDSTNTRAKDLAPRRRAGRHAGDRRQPDGRTGPAQPTVAGSSPAPASSCL